MTLKEYQRDTLGVLKRFFEACRIMGAEEAYRKITSEREIAARLGKLRGDYIRWDSIPNTPRVCLKVPTGGGKTIIASHAVKVVTDTWLEKEYPVVLWFCPSETIRKQTCEALKNPRHPYRMALDGQFDGRVRIFDLDEKFMIRPADIANGVCVVVATIQAFRQGKTDKYNVYRHNENLEPHFTHIATMDGMELNDSGKVKFSFANLLFYHRPIVIVDEAHNVISELSQEVQRRINPSAIVELTATPQFDNNTLYNVRAMELKDEDMIKLPIELGERTEWMSAVSEAIFKRVELEKAAENERDYIRPIVLFQAQDRNGEVNVEVLKKHLLETENIAEKEIAIATGEQKELDGIDVFSAACPIRYIITVEALKEGWDCSFAYVLCSLANVESNTAVEQLLGRVMRMPNAQRRRVSALNKAYAYVISDSFGKAAKALTDKLIAKGFDETEAEIAIQPQQIEFGSDGLFGRSDRVDLERPLDVTNTDIPDSIKVENDGKSVVFTPNTTQADVEHIAQYLARHHSEEEGHKVQKQFNQYKPSESVPSPAQQGMPFSIPKLMVEIQGELIFPEPDDIFEECYEWDIARYANPRFEAHEFSIEPQGNGFVINLDGNTLCFSPSGEQLYFPSIVVENWTVTILVAWLDAKVSHTHIPQANMMEWLRQVIEYLTDKRGLSLSSLMVARYALLTKIAERIKNALEKAREQIFQTVLFGHDRRIMLDFENGFEFCAGMYDDVELLYSGRYRFRKHYLGTHKIPRFDGKKENGEGEEFDCAMAIDALPQVTYWLRNAQKHRSSFRLPTSTDNFYPDFVAMLDDGRLLVVEYKGAHLSDNRDTKEKRMIGELWEKHAKGQGLFMIAEKSKDGLIVSEQIKKKIGVL